MRQLRRAGVAVLGLLGTMFVIPVGDVTAATGDPVLINEILASTTGTDNEFIELYGQPGASLDGLSILVIESDAGATQGQIDRRLDLSGALGDNGFFLIANGLTAATYGVTPDVTIANDFLENSTTTVVLVEAASLGGKGVGALVDGSIVVRDGVGYTDGGAGDVIQLGQPSVGPDGSFLPAGVRRIVDGVDTDTAADWAIADFNLGPANTPTAAASLPQATVVNAALVSTVGTDAEYLELVGEPGASLAGLSVIGIESDAGTSLGNIDHRYDLAADAVIGDNGYYLLANATAAGEFGITPNAALPANAWENSSLTIALVETSSIAGTTADTVGTVLDSVGVSDGGAGDTFAFGAPVVGPDGNFLPAGVRRAVAGVDTDTVADWVTLTFDPITAAINVPTVGTGGGGGGPTVVKIHEVQGAGAATPLDGQTVTIEGVVVGDEEGASPALRGFFVQEEDADADADPATSEGVFVFNGNLDSVNLGDQVRVTGTAGEFNSNTQVTASAIEVLATAQPLPTPATVEFPLATVDGLEAVEGMAATMPQALVISEYFNYDRFGEVVVALPAPGESRPFTPTALFAPDDPAAAERADLNARSRITIDDGVTAQNPATPIHPITRTPLSATNSFRGGDVVTGLTGPIWFAFNLYRVLPYGDGAGYDTYDQTVAPASPDPVGGTLRVAAFNALNYFLSIDTADTCGPTQDQDCRGADTVEEFDRQRVKLLNAIEGIDADVLGLIEVENTPGVEPLADVVAGLNDRLGAGTYDYIEAGVDSVVGTDAIKVGFVYQPAAVTPLGEAAVLDTPEFLDPNATGSPRNRAAVAQTFVENANGEVVSVVVNHWKSKGSSCGEAGEGPLVGSCDVTRTLTAHALLDWIATSPTGVADDDWMIVGDLNSYDHENPITVLEDAGYVDLAEAFNGEFAYSYGFDGQFGYLDYALASPSLVSQVTGATEWHINSDEADIYDYDTSFKSPAQQALFDPTTPFRSSDHDPVIVGLALDGVDAEARALPSRLWPVNRLLRPVLVFANDGRRLVPSDIVAVTSSEADSGLDRRDRPNDIVLVGDNLVLLRAEEYSSEGRSYTIRVEITDGGQVRFQDVLVTVGFR